MTTHAACSPSSAAMWMNCPASITKSAGMVRPSSRYAREGTAAHTIAEGIIKGDPFPPGKITVEGEQFIVGLPMLRALNSYIDLVQRIMAETKDVHIEGRVRLKGTHLVWGTADCAAKTGRRLRVIDLKYGMGVPVSPDSAQLKIYALGALDTFWPKAKIDSVELVIVQPRLDPAPRVHSMDFADLLEWHDDELLPAVRRVEGNDQTEKVGPYCRWCVRKPECRAFEAYKSTIAAGIFDDGIDLMKT